jgi:hypothetical protein
VGERAVVLSPLLNIAPASGTGATMQQWVRIVPLGGSRLAGSARLRLSPDRRTIEIELRLDRPETATIRLRRIEDGGDELLIVELVPSGFPGHALCRGRRFSLDRRQAFEGFAEPEQLRRAGIGLFALRAEAVEGIAVEAAASRDAQEDFTGRIRREIAAAECSATAAAASRHVELATLYARRTAEAGR